MYLSLLKTFMGEENLFNIKLLTLNFLMGLQLFFKWISQKMHLLSTRIRFSQPIGVTSKSPFSPAMYGLTKMSRKALPLFSII